MFEHMLESSPVRRKRTNPVAFVISLAIQTLAVGILILVPLLYTEALPKQEMLGWLVAPPPPPPPPPPPAAAPVKRVVRRTSLMDAGKLRAPKEIPREIAILKEEPIEDSGQVGVVGGVPGGVPGGQLGGVLGGVIGGIPSGPPPPKVTPQRIRVSAGVQEARRIHYVEPAFPPIARQARIQGTVRLQAIIGKDGRIQNLQVLDGHPLLVSSAVQAVQQWRYQPTLLNNEPVEVETIINVIFRMY